MESSVIAQEYQRFFSLFFSGKAFSCLLLTDSGDKLILKNTITTLQPEHKIWLSRLEFDATRKAIIREGHPLHLQCAGNCYAMRFAHSDFSMYVITAQQELSAISYLENLIPEIYTQLSQRVAAAQLIGRFQSRIVELETEKQKILSGQRGQLLYKVNQWKSGRTPAAEVDETLFDSPEHLRFPEDFIERLTRAYKLQKFLHPGVSAVFISREMLPEKRTAEPEQVKVKTWDRAAILLDKYEEAANNVLLSGLTVNGKTIAQFLVPAISPPAITDALKKNRKGIHTLLRENPAKWPLLRKNLKQVRELHENSGLFLQE